MNPFKKNYLLLGVVKQILFSLESRLSIRGKWIAISSCLFLANAGI